MDPNAPRDGSATDARSGNDAAGERPFLTQRRRDILDFIVRFQAEHQYPPTYREIGDEFDIRSPNGVMTHLNILREKGYLTWAEGKARTLRVL